MKKLSIITINYNNCAGLEKTIESVVHQTFNDYEYIVIDGGSTDGSVELLKKYSDKLTYWISEPDNGIYHAMNKGTRKATGEYCQYLNSGDSLVDNTVLERLFSNHIEADIFSTNSIWLPSKRRVFAPLFVTFRYLFEVGMNHQATFIKRTLLERYSYDESLKITGDYKFFLQAFIEADSSYAYYNIDSVYYDEGGISSTQLSLHYQEREHILSQLIPPRILKDYTLEKEKKQNNKFYKNLIKLDNRIQHPLLRSIIGFFVSATLELNRIFRRR